MQLEWHYISNKNTNRSLESYPRSPRPLHVFGVRDKVCVLSCLSTVTLIGVCRRDYHKHTCKLKYEPKLTDGHLTPTPLSNNSQLSNSKEYCLFSYMYKKSIVNIQNWTTMWNNTNNAVQLMNTIEPWSLAMFGLAKIIWITEKLNFKFN